MRCAHGSRLGVAVSVAQEADRRGGARQDVWEHPPPRRCAPCMELAACMEDLVDVHFLDAACLRMVLISTLVLDYATQM